MKSEQSAMRAGMQLIGFGSVYWNAALAPALVGPSPGRRKGRTETGGSLSDAVARPANSPVR